MTHHPFLTRLRQNPLLADGAMGTMLYSEGFPFDDCFDALNTRAPQVITNIHRAYLSNGAELIETNTFGANRFKLAEHGLRDAVAELNRRGVELALAARASIGAAAFVAGAIGPIGRTVAPIGRISHEEVRAAFAEQIAVLAEAGVDLLIFETFGSLSEIRQAILAARQVAPTLPIVASLTFGADGSTPLGHSPAEVAVALLELGVDVIGANCSSGPRSLLNVVQAMIAATGPETLVSAMPNAGWPEHAAGRILYPASPEYFGNAARDFAEAGVRLIGGCCGTTPAHILAMRNALDEWTTAGRQPSRAAPEQPARATVSASQREAAPQPPATQLARQLAEGRFVVTVEMEPPHGHDMAELLAAAAMLRGAGATVLNIADSPLARMRMSAWAAATLIQNRVGIETVLHFPTRGRNLLRIQGDLLAAHALGLRNLFVVMGDPTAIGDYPNATDSYDIVPTALTKLIKQNFNSGVDHGNTAIGTPTNFLVGCALNLTPTDMKKETDLLRKKIDAGADFALTMPVFEAEAPLRFAEAFGEPLPIPLIAGLMPLYSARNAAFLHNEVPGISIPETIRTRIAEAENQRTEGVAIAQEIMLAARANGVIQGVYIIPPFRKYEVAADVIGVLLHQSVAA
jgi:methionine synthase I (cobalamin-dependent)/5,10-methylenetetrahydrofolate reductase